MFLLTVAGYMGHYFRLGIIKKYRVLARVWLVTIAPPHIFSRIAGGRKFMSVSSRA